MEKKFKQKTLLAPIFDMGGSVIGDMSVQISEQCAGCKHLLTEMKCKAFPDGIPKAIIDGDVDHTKKYAWDHNIQFEV